MLDADCWLPSVRLVATCHLGGDNRTPSSQNTLINRALQMLGTSMAREAIGPEGREVVLIQAEGARAKREMVRRFGGRGRAAA